MRNSGHLIFSYLEIFLDLLRVFFSCKHSLNLIVKYEYESTTGTSKNVGKTSLEESFTTFILIDLFEAIHGTIVHWISSGFTSVHHKSSSNGIKRIRNNTSGNSDNLCETPHSKEVSTFNIFEQHNFTSIEHTEIWSSVSNDTNNWDTESIIETTDTSLSGRFLEAINETTEFSISTWTDISSKSCSSEIEWINKCEGSGTSSTTWSAVTNKEHTWLFLRIIWA